MNNERIDAVEEVLNGPTNDVEDMLDALSGPRFPDVEVELLGQDGNVFYIIGTVSKALKKAEHKDAADEFGKAAFGSKSYEAVLQLVMTYVEVV